MKTPRLALVTGASSGIGLELARLLARRGYLIAATSRDATRLEAAAQTLRAESRAAIHTLPQDLAAPGAVEALQAWLNERGWVPDVLVNNAGLGEFGAFGKSDWAGQRAMLDVNIGALTQLTHAFLPAMLERKRGRILHLASTASFAPGPLMAVYYASKAYVLSFSLALSNEVAGSGVTVSCLCPGLTRTRFQERAGLANSKLAQAAFMDAQSVAREGLRGLMRGHALTVAGRRNRAFVFAARHLSPTAVAALVRRVQDMK